MNSKKVSSLLVYFGQLLAHDVSMTGGSDVSGDNWPIELPECDSMFDPNCEGGKTLGFRRSRWNPVTGTSISNPRVQTNGITSFMDASMVYGETSEKADKLRSHVNGKLLLDENDLLPKTPDVEMAAEAQCPCIMRKAGDARANVHSILFSLHTIFVREHNRWCDVLHASNPSWDDEKLYQEARRRVIAIWQKISLYEYLPAVIGKPPILWTKYDPAIAPRLTHEFNVCAFRYGHSEIPSVIPRFEHDGSISRGGHLAIQENLFNAINGLQDQRIEPGIRGVTRQQPGEADLAMASPIRNFLFGHPLGTLGTDLAARSIQRGRDHGIRDYNKV